MARLSPMVKLAIVVVMLLVAVLAASQPASADRCGTEIYYYSDASYSEEIGMRGWLPYECGCWSYGWGSISPYRLYYDAVC